jgi:glycosyltransferase 2 family protein
VRRGQRLRRLAQRLYVVVLGAVLVVALVRSRADLALLLRGARLPMLGLALMLSFGQLWLNSLFWSAALRAFGSPVPSAPVLSATARSLPARYVPGSLWYPLGRAALLAAGGVSKRALGAVAAVEAVLSVVVAFCMGGALLALAGRLPAGAPAAAAACVLLLTALSPPVLNRVLPRLRPSAPAVTWAAYVVLVALMAAFWALSAVVFVLYLSAFPGVRISGAAQVAGAFLVAWGVGFLAVFAPQGAGVFEVTVAALLVAPQTAAVALVVAGFRAVIAVRDLVAFSADALVRTARRPAPRGSARSG